MQISTAVSLAHNNGKRLVNGINDATMDIQSWNPKGYWKYEDSLYVKQILQLDEQDFVDYYLI